MAKAKNRDKRKKAAVKKANQVKAGKPEMYEGFIRIPLSNSFTSEEIRIRTEYEGDWLDRKRYCATIEYQSYGGRETIPDAANMAVDAARNGSGLMDMSKTYIIVRAQKDMTKFPKEIDVEALQAERQKQAPVMGVAQPFDYNYLFEEFVKEAKA